MKDPKEYDLDWQALRYAADKIDLGFCVEAEDLYGTTGPLYEQKREEMKAHRERIVRMIDEALENKYKAEDELKKEGT